MKKLFWGLFALVFVNICGMERFDSPSAIASMYNGYINVHGENIFHLLASMLMDDAVIAEIAQECLEKKAASVDLKRASDGRNPLHCAVASGKEELVNVLLKKSTQELVNDRDINQQTALHSAVGEKNITLVYQLLLHGADPSLVDNAGKRPITLLIESALRNKVIALCPAGGQSWFITNPIMQLLCTYMEKKELLEERDYAWELFETNDLKEENKDDYEEYILNVLSGHSRRDAYDTHECMAQQAEAIMQDFYDNVVQKRLKKIKQEQSVSSNKTLFLHQQLKKKTGIMDKATKKSLAGKKLDKEDLLHYRDLQREEKKKEGCSDFVDESKKSAVIVVYSQNGMVESIKRPTVHIAAYAVNPEIAKQKLNKSDPGYPTNSHEIIEPLKQGPAFIRNTISVTETMEGPHVICVAKLSGQIPLKAVDVLSALARNNHNETAQSIALTQNNKKRSGSESNANQSEAKRLRITQ